MAETLSSKLAFCLEPSWQAVLEEELQQPYLFELADFVEKERGSGVPIYPPKELIFNALNTTPYSRVNVVIVGQDPYHGPGQAHGLSFSVPKGVPPPPSLQNIFKEIREDIGPSIKPFPHGCLLSWAHQGVLLLNAILTVRGGQPKSHHNKGWERFTDAVIGALSRRQDSLIFVLWGKSAQEKCLHVLHGPEVKRHFLLTAPHPSPYSVHTGFFGCRHFSQINKLLLQQGKAPIDWQIR